MIKTIKYNGKEYPYRVSYKALKRVKAKLGREFTLSADTDYDALEWLMFFAIQVGCEKTEMEFDLKFEQMEELMDEHISEVLSGVEAFSHAVKKAADEKENPKG